MGRYWSSNSAKTTEERETVKGQTEYPSYFSVRGFPFRAATRFLAKTLVCFRSAPPDLELVVPAASPKDQMLGKRTHRPPAGVDLDGMDLWARQLLVDAAAKDRGAIAGDAATLRVLWDRAGHSIHTTDPTPPSGSAPRCGPLARRRTRMDLRRQLRGSRPFELRCRHEGTRTYPAWVSSRGTISSATTSSRSRSS